MMSEQGDWLQQGGLTYRFARLLGLQRLDVPSRLGIVIALLVIVLTPLVAATLVAGTFDGGVHIPLLHDYTVLSRFLVAMPLLVLAVPAAEYRLVRIIDPLRRLVAPAQQADFDRALQQLRMWRGSVYPELVLFALAVVGSFSMSLPGLNDGVSDWREGSRVGGLSVAGMWLMWLATPIFRFICLLWLWRLVLWACLLWRFARLDLALHAAHPDGRGGLEFLGYAQRAFTVLPLIGGVMLAGNFVDQVKFYGATFNDLRGLMIGYIVLGTALPLLPLLLLAPRLVRLKQQALLDYGAIGTDSSEKFEQKWLGRRRGDAAPLLEAGDSSALTDLTGVYGTVSRMSMVPFGRDLVLSFAMAAALPLLSVLMAAGAVQMIVSKLLSVLV